MALPEQARSSVGWNPYGATVPACCFPVGGDQDGQISAPEHSRVELAALGLGVDAAGVMQLRIDSGWMV